VRDDDDDDDDDNDNDDDDDMLATNVAFPEPMHDRFHGR